jgi:hypothetical protein
VGSYNIVNAGTGRCLDAFASYGGGNGNLVGLFDCNGGVTETWDIRLRNDGQTYLIWNARNGRSLDYPEVSGGAVGYQYTIWDYIASSAGQVFRIFPVGPNNSALISNDRASGVMDAFQVDGGGNGNRVGNWGSDGSPLQGWYFRCVNGPCYLGPPW